MSEKNAEEKIKNILVFGATGTIGAAILKYLSMSYPSAQITGVSRRPQDATADLSNVTLHICDYGSDTALAQLSKIYEQHHAHVDELLITTGVLTAILDKPEKSVQQIDQEELLENLRINAVIPALIFKHFFRLLASAHAPRFGALSARIGSISDNRLGGWYAYRMAKSALNMFIKTASLELKRKNKQSVVVGLHPGTVKTKFSERFIKHTTKNCFTPEVAASQLIDVFQALTPAQSGGCFAWDGTEILP
ncbi:SDR family NAD(P)-dependent oxidoreductase [Burkholderiales bacterium]|nr:SDR family NAD(P)-dependent oxidoreductase [Burkholderiales bacterium]